MEETDVLHFAKGGIHGKYWTVITKKQRAERWLNNTFGDQLVWATNKSGKRELGRVQHRSCRFVGTEPITGFPIFECDVYVLSRKDTFKLHSGRHHLTLDQDIPESIELEADDIILNHLELA